MKKVAKVFFTIAKILDILAIVGYAIGVIIGIVTAISGAAAYAAAVDAGTYSEEQLAALAIASTTGIVVVIVCIVCLILCIIGTVFAFKASKRLNTAKSKDEAKGMAIAAIITGLLSTEFALVAGILMLCMKDEQYSESEPVEVKAE